MSKYLVQAARETARNFPTEGVATAYRFAFSKFEQNPDMSHYLEGYFQVLEERLGREAAQELVAQLEDEVLYGAA